MREHKILIWCDVHAHRGDEDTPASHTLMLAVSEIEATSTPGGRQIDICDACLAEIAGLVEVVEEQGAKPGETTSRPTKTYAKGGAPQKSKASGSCPLCGEHYEWLATHVGAAHGISITEATKTKGGKFACPECGETFGGTTPLGSHAMKDHGAPTAVLLARKQAAA